MSNLENACFKACDDWVNEIECNIEPDYSKEHIKRIKEISKGKGNTRFGRKKLRILLVAAIVLLLNITAFAAVQSKQLNFIKGLIPNTYIFRVDNPVYKSVDDIEYGYIPEGFKEVDRKYMFKGILVDIDCPECQVMFSDGEQHFFVVKNFEAAQFSFDSETETVTRFEDNGINYVYTEPTDKYKGKDGFVPWLYWNNDGYSYFVTGYESSISCEELLKIARDVK